MKQRIVELSWLKMNVLHLHLSDSLGFRIHSDSHPEIVTEPALSKQDIREILAVAKRHNVTVIPEIDSPGHLEAALAPHPEWQLVLADGRRYPANLDYSKPEARRFVADLIEEYAELFDGPWFHLGGDEYFGYPWDQENHITAENAPRLMAFARDRAGPDATLVDGFDAYLNELVERLHRHGKRPRVWNDHVAPSDGRIGIDPSPLVEFWIRWNTDEPSVTDVLTAGYEVNNAHGDHLYFILADGQQHQRGKKSAQGIYDLWDPLVLIHVPGEDDTLARRPSGHRGAHLSV